MPDRGLQLQSTLRRSGELFIELAHVRVRPPTADEVVVRMVATPINPSDLVGLLSGVDVSHAQFSGSPDRPRVSIQLPHDAVSARSARLNLPMEVGLEGAGVVVAAGEYCSSWVGQNVALFTLARGALAQYVTVPTSVCVPLPRDLSLREGCALFVNPLAALAIAETVKLAAQSALVQTAAASNLGQMLLRICQEDGLALVNIVRRAEQAELLREMGASYVCNSSSPNFSAELTRAITETGARVGFDATGGGSLANEILLAMEAAAASKLTAYSPYGSLEMKHIYVYGRLDPAPMQIMHDRYGLQWRVEAWAMPAILERIGPERSQGLRQRIIASAKTTFASTFTHQVSLADVLLKENMVAYCRQSTGQKCLVYQDS